jgi:5-methylcytosine-specific restriction endonuclease McrA
MPPRACIQRYRGNCSDGGIAMPHSSRCRAHGGNSGWARYAQQHPERTGAYHGPLWRDRRDAQLRDHPSCAHCGRPAVDADHILAVSLGGSFDGPLQSLCRRCHLIKTAEDSKAAKRRRQG